MGLRNFVQQQVLVAFKQLGDIARPATYKSLTGVVIRDIVAGTSVPQTVDYALPRTVFTKFKETEMDNSVSPLTDQKFLFPSLDLPVQPKAADLVVDERNDVWEIIKRFSDPASAVVILHVRTSRKTA